MNEKTKKMLDEVLDKTEKITQEWITEQKKLTENKVRQMLDCRKESIIAKLMGFENDPYDGWKVDHCNGRAGESAAGDWLRERAGETAKTWLSEQIGNFPDLPNSAIVSLKRDYQEELQRSIRRILEAKAKEDARKMVEEYFTEEPNE